MSRWRYAIVRGIFVPFMRVWWGLRIKDAERIPAEGPAIMTPNHKSFWDSFFLAAATKRHLRFMGKSELFEGRLGKTFVRLGAFPVRRGESDAEALETAPCDPRAGRAALAVPGGHPGARPGGRSASRSAARSGSPSRRAHRSSRPRSRARRSSSSTASRGRPPSGSRSASRFRSTSSSRRPRPPRGSCPTSSGRRSRASSARLRAHPGLIAAGLAAVGLGAVVATRRHRGGKGRRRR